MKKLLLKQLMTKRLVLLVLSFILLMPSTAWGEEYTYDSFGDWSGNAGMYSCLTIDFQNSTTVYSPEKFSNISKVEIVAGGASQIYSSFAVSVNGSDYQSIVSTTGNGYVIPENVNYDTYTFEFTPDETPQSVVISAQYNAVSGMQGWVYIKSVTVYTEEEKNPEPYAVLSNNNTVLTFYYDGNKVSQNGYGIGPFELTDTRWGGNSSTITKVVFDSSFKNCTSITSTAFWFLDCYYLTTIEGIDNLKTSNVVDMTAMFTNCQSLTSLTLWNFDTSNVTHMNSMFQDCSSLVSLNLEGFNTEKVTDMNCMFRGCKKLPSLLLTDFNTKNVTNMWCMFFDCNALTTLDIYYFDTSNVTDMNSMFQDCSSLSYIDLRGFNTEKVTDMGQMFDGCSKLTKLDMSKFNTQNVTNFQCLFMNCAELTTLDLTTFNTAQVEHMGQVFEGCSKLKTIYVDKDKWTTSAVTFGPNTFDGCTSLIGGAGTAYNAEQINYTYARVDGGTDNPGYFTLKDGSAMESCDMSEIPTDNAYYAATSFLCERRVLDGSKVEGKYKVEEMLLRQHLANITFRGLFTLNGREIPSTFVSDQYPDIYDDLKSDAPYYQAAKTLLYLDYGDGITPFDRDREGFLPDDNEARINVLKELMEAFNIKSDMEGTDNPFPNEPNMAHLSETSPIKMGYVRQAAKLGIITTENEEFRPYAECSRGEAFLMLARIIQKIEAGEITDPNPQESDFLDPNNGTGTADPNAEAYAVLSDNNTVLTFYYDGQKESRGGGLSIGPFSYITSWDKNKEKITTVVFDNSFADYTGLTSTYYWFAFCKNLTTVKGIKNLRTDNVTNMYAMFWSCEKLTSLDVSGFKTDNVTDLTNTFADCSSLTSLDVGHFNTEKVTSMHCTFDGCSGLTSLDVSHFKTGNVKYMGGLFCGCSCLTSIDVSNFNTEKVTDMSSMFRGCSGLKNLDITNFNTEQVTNMYFMFSDCPGLKSLDLSNFNTAKVTNMGFLFNNCINLETIYVGKDWSTANVTSDMFNDKYVFSWCSKLIGGAGTTYSSDNYDLSYARVDGGTDNPGYFTLKDGSAMESCDMSEIPTDNAYYAATSFLCERGILDGSKVDGKYKVEEMLLRQHLANITFRGLFTLNGREIPSTFVSDQYPDIYDDLKSDAPYYQAAKALLYLDYGDGITPFDRDRDGFLPGDNEARINVLKELMEAFNIKPDMEGTDNPFPNEPNMAHLSETSPIKIGYVRQAAKLGIITTENEQFRPYDECSRGEAFLMLAHIIQKIEAGEITDPNPQESDFLDPNSGTGTADPNAEAYAVLSDNNTVLTFYYDDQKTERNGMSVGPFSGSPDFQSWYAQRESITSVVFDDSFANCTTLTSTAYWFYGFKNLSSITGIGNLKTDNVEYMRGMFEYCGSLTSLDLSGFKTNNVTDMSWMFWGCSSLTTIYAGDGWSTAKVTNIASMFYGCMSLVGGAGTHFDEGYTNQTYAHIDGGASNPGYFTAASSEPWQNSDEFEPYAVLTDNDDEITTDEGTNKGKTLTFYYDNQKEDRGGMSVVFSSTADRGWGIECENITKAVFDGSFANCTTLTSTRWWFLFCKNLKTIIGITNLKTDNVTNMTGMFYGCSSLTSLDLSSLNTSSLNIMYGIFQDCSSLKSINLTNFKTDNVEDMGQLFLNCSSLESLDVSGFKTDGVTSMFNMFRGCSSLKSLDLSIFNTKKVRNMGQMFRDCSNLATINVGGDWNTEAVTESTDMFINCTSLVGGAGTSYSPDHIKKEYAHIDGGADNPGYFTEKNATPVEDGSEPYAVLSYNNTVLTFYYDSKKESRGGLSVGPFADEEDRAWNNYRLSISSVVFDKSFANCTTLTSTAYWFYECSNLTDITGISNLKTDHVTDMMFMFHGCESLTSIDVSGFKTDNLENMQGMFFRCEQLTSMDLSGFNTEKVTNMSALFSRCEGMTSVDLSGFKTDLVTDMRLMFNQCSSLTSLNLTDFNTEKVSDMGYMFADCSSLSTIYVSNTGWNLSQLLDGTGMFENCTSLAGGAGTTFDTSYIDETYAHIDGGTANPGYFTAKAGGSGDKSEGDLNGDGNVDNADMEVLVSVVMGGDKDKLADADLNHDGKVDVADIVTLVNMIRSQE